MYNLDQKVGGGGGLTLFKKEKIKCDNKPFRTNILVLKPGIYAIEFNNQYSWYNEKFLRYRINVLEPIELVY